MLVITTIVDTYRVFLNKPDTEITTPLIRYWAHSYLSDEETEAIGVMDLA